MPPRPRCLAQRMAASACAASAFAVAPSAGYSAIPMLAELRTSIAPMRIGSCSDSSARNASRLASSMCSTELISRTNSSPPERATVSTGPTSLARRRETSCSSSSPALCPSDSLTSLNRSRPHTINAKGRESRSACAAAWLSRSSRSTRFGRPVSASWVARWRSWRFAASKPRVRDLITSSRLSSWRRTRRSFCHFRLSDVAHCSISMGSAGFLSTRSLSEYFNSCATSDQS